MMNRAAKIAASRLDDLSDYWINYWLPVPVGKIQAELTEHGGDIFSAADAGSGNDRPDWPARSKRLQRPLRSAERSSLFFSDENARRPCGGAGHSAGFVRLNMVAWGDLLHGTEQGF